MLYINFKHAHEKQKTKSERLNIVKLQNIPHHKVNSN